VSSTQISPGNLFRAGWANGNQHGAVHPGRKCRRLARHRHHRLSARRPRRGQARGRHPSRQGPVGSAPRLRRCQEVFWQVASSATIGTNAKFVGTVMTLASVTVKTNAVVQGRTLAQREGSVRLDTNVFSGSACNLLTPSPSPDGNLVRFPDRIEDRDHLDHWWRRRPGPDLLVRPDLVPRNRRLGPPRRRGRIAHHRPPPPPSSWSPPRLI